MLAQIALNLLLAVVWMFLRNEVSAAQFVTGYLLGAAVLTVLGRGLVAPLYVRQIVAAVRLFGMFVVELIQANLAVARKVVEPNLTVRPGIVALPIDVRSDFEITLLANMITLTPGTLTLDVSPDRRYLYIHTLDVPDPDAVRRQIKERFERGILLMTRGKLPGGGGVE